MAGGRGERQVLDEDARVKIDRMLDAMQFDRDELEMREMNGMGCGGKQNRILRRIRFDQRFDMNDVARHRRPGRGGSKRRAS